MSFVNPLTSHQTVQSSFEDPVLFVYGVSDGHKQSHIFRVLFDIFFDVMKPGKK